MTIKKTLQRLYRQVFSKPKPHPLPTYQYQFASVDFQRCTMCVVTAHCSVTKELYQERIIMPIQMNVLLRSEFHAKLVKEMLRRMMNNRLGVEVKA